MTKDLFLIRVCFRKSIFDKICTGDPGTGILNLKSCSLIMILDYVILSKIEFSANT